MFFCSEVTTRRAIICADVCEYYVGVGAEVKVIFNLLGKQVEPLSYLARRHSTELLLLFVIILHVDMWTDSFTEG